MIRFCSYLTDIDQGTENATIEKHKRNIQILVRKLVWGMLSDREKHIQNILDNNLSDTEKVVLCDSL